MKCKPPALCRQTGRGDCHRFAFEWLDDIGTDPIPQIRHSTFDNDNDSVAESGREGRGTRESPPIRFSLSVKNERADAERDS